MTILESLTPEQRAAREANLREIQRDAYAVERALARAERPPMISLVTGAQRVA
jgi:hypothetical protein